MAIAAETVASSNQICYTQLLQPKEQGDPVMIYDNILQTIGSTPVVRLNRMAPDHVEMFVKIESFNPLASG